MKKLLYLIPLLFIIVLTSCDTSDIQNEIHEYVLKYDNEEHYQECECGDTIEIESHTFSEPIIRLEPTCTNTGIKEYKCTGCDFIKLEDIEALGHIEIIDKAIQVGCENEGLTEGSHCERCNQVLTKQEAIECIGHDYTEFNLVTPATCEGEGLEKKVCNNCSNEVFNTLPATGHSYSEFVTSKEPTCEGEGLEKKVCDSCGNEVFNTLPAAGHSYSEFVASKEPTCEGEGLEKKTCIHCPSEIFNTLEPTCHSYSEFTTSKEPKCEETGLKYRTCSCGHVDYQEIEATGHTPVDGEALNSTCTEYGHTSPVLCDDCGVTLTKEELLPLLEHNYGVGVVTQEATITHTGIVEYACQDCENVKRVHIPRVEVTTELLSTFNTKIFTEDVRIVLYIGTNDYDLEYIKSGETEYLSVIDRVSENEGSYEYYKFEYNGLVLQYNYDVINKTLTHELYDEDTSPFKVFKDYIIEKNQFGIDNFASLKRNGGYKYYEGTVTYKDTSYELSYNVNEIGMMTSTQIFNVYTANIYYDTYEITIPRKHNLHTLPEDGKCATCTMPCFTVKNYNDNYKEEYYIYDDQTYAYSSFEIVGGTLPTYCKTKILKGTNAYYDITYFIVRNYIKTNIEIYSFEIIDYSYNAERGYLSLNYKDGDSTKKLTAFLKSDGSMQISSGGSSVYEIYPETHLNSTFEYRYDYKAYQFRFTENVMYIEVYETNDIVYLPETDTAYTKIQDGWIAQIFKRKGNISVYIPGLSESFSSGKITVNYNEITFTCSALDINITGTIYDIECLNEMYLYYWIETAEGTKYKLFIEDGYVHGLEEL